MLDAAIAALEDPIAHGLATKDDGSYFLRSCDGKAAVMASATVQALQRRGYTVERDIADDVECVFASKWQQRKRRVVECERNDPAVMSQINNRYVRETRPDPTLLSPFAGATLSLTPSRYNW